MANTQHHHKLPPHAQRYLVTGILTIIPIWITWLVFEVVWARSPGPECLEYARYLGRSATICRFCRICC